MSFTAFVKKEMMETYKTPKAIILGVLFLFFGILSPLTARYMNEFLAMAMQQQGTPIVLPDPTYIQAYEQFFKNLYFMMIIVSILVFAGTVAEEKSRGTAVLVLTKCLSRTGFILSKLISAILVFSLFYVAAAAICIYYTSLLFTEFINPGVWTALMLYWLYGCLMLSLTLLASILSKTMTVAAVLGFVCYAVISAVSALPSIGGYTPGVLQGLSYALSSGAKEPGDALIPALVTLGAMAAATAAGLVAFRRQEL